MKKVWIILADQLSYKFVNYNGFNEWIITPCINELASKGITYRQAYCSSPLCIPSRHSLYTGRNTRHHGCICDHKILDKPTIFHHLADQGIKTYAVGKMDFRFDEDQYHGIMERPAFEAGAQDMLPGTNNFSSFIGKGVTTLERERDEQCDRISLASLEVMSRPETSVLVTSYLKPHDSWDNGLWWDAPRSFWEMYPELTNSLQGYAANVSLLDHHLGWLLREAQNLQDTLIIFASDHGELAGEHGRWGKQSMHEESIRVPMIMWHKGIVHRFCNEVRGLIDIFPTVFDYLNLPCPTTDGVSLLGEYPLNRHVFSEVFWGKYVDEKYCSFEEHKPYSYEESLPNLKRCIRQEKWKYVDDGFSQDLFYVTHRNCKKITTKAPDLLSRFRQQMEELYPACHIL